MPQGLQPSLSQMPTTNTDFCLSKAPVHSQCSHTKKRPQPSASLWITHFYHQKKSHFSSILKRGSWGRSRLLSPFEWDYPCILASAIKGSTTRWESLEFWFPIICQTLNKPLKFPNEWYLWMRNRNSLFLALIWGWGLSSCCVLAF